MIKNRVCVQKIVFSFVIMSLLAVSPPAMAFVASVVSAPGVESQQKLHFAFDKAKFKKEVLKGLKDFAMYEAQKKIQEATGLNLVTGFKNLNKKLDEKLGFVVDSQSAVAQAQEQGAAMRDDAANINALRRQNGEIAADMVKDVQGTANYCYAQQNQKTIDTGGPQGDINDKRGKTRITFGGRSRGTFERLKTGVKDKNGKVLPPTTPETATIVASRQDEAKSLSDSNTIGSNGAKGPIVYRRDQANAFLNNYLSNDSFFGAVKAAGIEVGPDGDLKAGLDTRASDLLSVGGPQLSLLCFQNAATGTFILDGFDAAFCGKDPKYYWENAVKTGVNGEKPMDKVIDLATAYVIRDYIVPPPFSSFTPQFLKAVQANNAGAQEILAKRQAFNAAASLVAGIYNKRIADITPQAMSDAEAKIFKENWKAVYPTTPVPALPSKKARLDIAVEYFRTQDYISQLINTLSGNNQKTPEAMSVGLQKDILYSLERIELLLATMLSNDLQERRAGIEQQINVGNSKTGGGG